jgi:polar amino acid transport system ATP-binding protein
VTSVSLTGKDIHLSFGTNKVLRGVSLHVDAGKTTTVIGPSGSGKSTLLRALNRLHEPEQGDILLDGKSIRTNSGSGSAWCSSTSTCSRTRPSRTTSH